MGGKRLWLVLVSADVSVDGELTVESDNVRVLQNGSLEFVKESSNSHKAHWARKLGIVKESNGQETTTLIIPSGGWRAIALLDVGSFPIAIPNGWPGVSDARPY